MIIINREKEILIARLAYVKNKKELIPNTIFIGFLFLIGIYTPFGIVAFWLLTAMFAFQAIRYLINLGLGIMLATVYRNLEAKEEKALKWKTTLVMTIELAIDISFFIPLYKHLY